MQLETAIILYVVDTAFTCALQENFQTGQALCKAQDQILTDRTFRRSTTERP